MDAPVNHFDSALKHAADNALLPPHFAFAQLSISKETRQLCARPGPAWRAVVRFTGTQYKIFTIHSRQLRRREQLNVIDFMTAVAGNAVSIEGLPNGPCEVGKGFHVVQGKFIVVFDEEKPIPAPRNISVHN